MSTAGSELLLASGRDEKLVRVLLVEDDAVDRMAFERLLRQEDLPYELTSVESLADGLEKLANDSFGAVFADYQLGDGTAFDILALGLDLPVIVVTGAGDEEVAVRAMRAGAFDYLVKDVDQRYLKMVPVTLENACQHYASKRQARMLSQAVTCLNDCVYVTDLEGEIVFVNATFLATYAYTEEEVLGQSVEVLWAKDAAQDLRPLHPRVLPPDGERGECRHRRKNGSELTVELSRSAIVDERGQPMAVVGVVRDVSDQKCWEKVLRESEERYALAAAGTNDGLWDWDLERASVYYSPRFKSILGYGPDDDVGHSPDDWFERVHEDDLALLKAQLDAHLEGFSPHFENEHRIRTRAGDYRWVQARGLLVRGDDAKPTRVAGSLRDIADQKRAEEQLLHSAIHDNLTGLPNRALFMDRLGNAILHSKRRGDYLFGVVFCDLDRFKVINDSLGHLAGDQLLRSVARRLETCLRLGDTVARLGGDEFAILVDDVTDVAEVHRVARRIHDELEAPFEIQGREFFTTASLGIAMSSPDYIRPEEILRDADTAMYRAKSRGRTELVVFHKEMHTDVIKLLDLETDLRRAVERREFRMFYQPIVRLRTGFLAGFEALIRWQHPDRGLLAPGDFLPAAVDAGLMESINWWVLEEACGQVQRWRAEHPSLADVAVSVNLDVKQLSSFEMVERVEEVLAATGLDPAGLKLEITEGMLSDNPKATAAVLHKLREREIGLHIDDFGTGYSSLSQLHRFPIDALKVDRSFVHGMAIDDENLEIVRTILSLAKNLGLGVIAEGVESVEQLAQLRALGCGCAQGYMFARPMSPEEVEQKIESGNWGLIAHPGQPAPIVGEPSGVIERLSLLKFLNEET